MADDKLASIWKTQKSLTEWFEDIQHTDAALMRCEDNDKRERLKVLNRVIGLPFDKPVQFEATDLASDSPAFQEYRTEHSDDLCALRLIPKEPDLPKLRMRGKTVARALDWFHEQTLDPAKYRADFIPHTEDSAWATIFIVNQYGIQGEIIYGGHHQLTQGFHETAQPSVFSFDFINWSVSPHDDKALEHLKKLAQYLYVPEQTTQDTLHLELAATFSNNYLEGYFETTDSSAGTWFIDYSPVLGKMYADEQIRTVTDSDQALVSGLIGCKGQATGTVRLVGPDELNADFTENSILVCSVTTPDYVPLMQKAGAIVTDQGGILSHAAIVARELKKPCIVATGNATSLLKDGQVVTVDADNGVVIEN